MNVQEQHITTWRDSGVQGYIDKSSLLREMTVGFSGTPQVLQAVRSLDIRAQRLMSKILPHDLDKRRPLPPALPSQNILSLRKQRNGSFRTPALAKRYPYTVIVYQFPESTQNTAIVYQFPESTQNTAIVYQFPESTQNTAIVYQFPESTQNTAIVYQFPESTQMTALINLPKPNYAVVTRPCRVTLSLHH
ncbi:hypothetical protein J6590_017965 [Homalodisca vitripennis]|nr:hypothetical protein J6590_017965 [Homalodisca vitripennis]